MSKYRIVEFTDGTFGAEKLWFFGKFGSGQFLSVNGTGNLFSIKTYIRSHCRFDSIKCAEHEIKLMSNKTSDTFKVKRVVVE